MRLIDADALLEKLMKDPLYPIVAKFNIGGVIDTAPTVEERKEGKWIPVGEIDIAGNQTYICSVCHSGESHVPSVKVSYCWNCGAKMEE